MTGVFFSVTRYPCHIHLPVYLWVVDPHTRVLKKEWKLWKWSATARYYTSLTKTMLPMWKSMPRSSRQSDHMKTSWPSSLSHLSLNREGRWGTTNDFITRFLHHKEMQTAVVGHVSYSLGLAETILQGTVKGGRRTGRQMKRWEDNIREWTGLEFAKSQMAVENREKWKKLVVKSSMVPQWPSELKDSWAELTLFPWLQI